MQWFAIRGIYLHGRDEDGSTIFEERLLLFRTDSADSAIALAEIEAHEYLQINPEFRRVGEWGAFSVHASVNDLHGAEVWSVLSASGSTGEAYYRQRYRDRELPPDDIQDHESAG